MLTPEQKLKKNAYQRARYAANPEVRARHNANAKRWSEKNPERRREIHLEWRTKNPDRFRTLARKAARKRLGIPEPTRPAPEGCECCGKTLKLHVDHDHTTGLFRGWLCNHCNMCIGKLGDNIAGVKRAMDYLIRTKST